MSWITGLVDKAENILDKLDQNAATALQNQGNSASSTVSNSVESTEYHQGMLNTTQTMKESLSDSIQSLIPPVTSPFKQTNLKVESVIKTESAETDKSLYLERTKINSAQHTLRRSTADVVAIDIDAEITSRSLNACTATDRVGENKELKAFKIALAEVTSECDDLRQRYHALLHDEDNFNLKQRYNELEILANRLTVERNQMQSQLTDAQTSSSAYLLSLSEMESNLAKSHQKNFELAQKLEMQIKETTQQRQDLEEYRKKAYRALQIKDNLIAELKLSSSERSLKESNEDANELCIVKIDLNTVKQKLQSLREEKATLLQHLEEARKDLKDSSMQHSAIIGSMLSKEDGINKELRLEKQRSMQLESEQRVLTQELITLRQQLNKQMETATKLQDNAQLIPLLKTENKSTCSDYESYNMRIKSLTEALVDKQNCVEHITADRNALRIQLEKVQGQIQQISFQGSGSSNRGQRNILLSNTTDDVKAQFPLLMKETPFDNRVARRVKRVYSSLDSAGIRLGAFLRRYPLMRIVVLIYVGLLHLWVIFVLLSSTPT